MCTRLGKQGGSCRAKRCVPDLIGLDSIANAGVPAKDYIHFVWGLALQKNVPRHLLMIEGELTPFVVALFRFCLSLKITCT